MSASSIGPPPLVCQSRRMTSSSEPLPSPRKRQVERERDQRALGVVADRRVRRVLVGAVVLDPGIEARRGDALHRASGRRLDRRDRRRQQLQVARRVDQAGAQHEQVVVVRGEAFEEPEQLGVVLARVVERRELARLQPLDVPGVEVLVRDQAEHADVAVARLGLARALPARPARRGRSRRGATSAVLDAVLEAAAAVLERVEHEQVALERRPAAAVPEARSRPRRCASCRRAAARRRSRARRRRRRTRAARRRPRSGRARSGRARPDGRPARRSRRRRTRARRAPARGSSVVATSQPAGRPRSASACGSPSRPRRAGTRRCR